MLNTKLWMAQRGLNSDSAQKRLEAVQRIRALKDPEAIEVLTKQMQDPEPAVRVEVNPTILNSYGLSLEDVRAVRVILEAHQPARGIALEDELVLRPAPPEVEHPGERVDERL